MTQQEIETKANEAAENHSKLQEELSLGNIDDVDLRTNKANFILGFLAGSKSQSMIEWGKQSIIDAKVFKICDGCNNEFELNFGVSSTEKVTAFQTCPHCKKRNDTWISIRLTPPPPKTDR